MRFKVFDVFADKPFEGNPTGIVYWEGKIDKSRMQKIASELSVPDTLFIIESLDPTFLFSSFAFSPYEELSVCGQGIVGGIFALIEDRKISTGTYEIETLLGKLKVFVDDQNGPAVFASLGHPKIFEVNDREQYTIFEVLDKKTFEPLTKYFVELGRKRLLLEVPFDILKKLSLESSDVMVLCRQLEVTGIVFFSRDKSRSILFRSRHFTTSLNGSEDAVTGGASGAILAFCSHKDTSYVNKSVVIHQGGFNTRRGYIYVKFDKSKEEILVGGQAFKISEGQMYI
jgi:PhzF family phenazine biosynthesis protein